MSINRQILLDSTYRNRAQYPLQSQFIILPDQQNLSQAYSGLNTDDGVALAYPIYPTYPTAAIFAGGTAAAPMLDANASSLDNFYVNYYLEDTTIGESRLITSYDAPTKTATLLTAFSGAWAAGDSFVIRQQLPALSTTVAAVTSTTVTLTAGSSTNGIYVGNYVYFPTVGATGLITAYDGAALTVTFTTPLASLPAPGDAVEILLFSYDNVGRLYNIITSINDVDCYEISLLSINLPNVFLSNSGGGKLINYSYILIELKNVSLPSNGNSLITNNPNARRALFSASIDDTPNADLAFIKLDGDGAVQTINFNPYSDIKLSIYLSNGELIRTLGVDTLPPQPPNPLLQIMVEFQIKRLSCGKIFKEQ